MKVKWLGHSSFLITAEDGTKIITDPYTPGMMGLNYESVKDVADIVTVSHEHGDHNAVGRLPGSPEVVRDTGAKVVKGIEFKGMAAYHDASRGGQRGANTIFCFTVDGVRVCHLGDLGHQLTDAEIAEVGQVDVLLIPVGGNFTIDAAGATQVLEKIKPRVVMPMHYRNEKCPQFPVAGVDDFLKGKTNVTRETGSEVEFKAGQLPATTQIVVLQPAC